MKKDRVQGQVQVAQDKGSLLRRVIPFKEPAFVGRRFGRHGYDAKDVDTYIQAVRQDAAVHMQDAQEKAKRLSAEMEKIKLIAKKKEQRDIEMTEEVRRLQDDRKNLKDSLNQHFQSMQEKERYLATATAELREIRQVVQEQIQKEASEFIEGKRIEVEKEILVCFEELAKIAEAKDQIAKEIQMQKEEAKSVLEAFRKSLGNLLSIAQTTLQEVDSDLDMTEAAESEPQKCEETAEIEYSEEELSDQEYTSMSSGF